MRFAKVMVWSATLGLATCTTGAADASSVSATRQSTAEKISTSGERFAGTRSQALNLIEGCWFTAHVPVRLHRNDKSIHGETKISRCTTPAPVYCRLQSRLEMWISYSGQWVQKGKWKDSGWRTCRPGRTLTPSYKCPRHSAKHYFITDSWLAIVDHEGQTATNYVTSPKEKFVCG